MSNRDFVEENRAARLELGELIGRLDASSFDCAVGTGWTVSTLLCHLAFWDRRAVFLLRKWQSGEFEPSVLSSLSIDSINQAVKTMSHAVPGPEAARLALESAAAVDSQVMQTSDELVNKILSAGFERFLRRSLHRREHLQKIKEALAG